MSTEANDEVMKSVRFAPVSSERKDTKHRGQRLSNYLGWDRLADFANGLDDPSLHALLKPVALHTISGSSRNISSQGVGLCINSVRKRYDHV